MNVPGVESDGLRLRSARSAPLARSRLNVPRGLLTSDLWLYAMSRIFKLGQICWIWSPINCCTRRVVLIRNA